MLPPEEFQKLPEEEQKRLQGEMDALQEQLQKVAAPGAALEAGVRGSPAGSSTTRSPRWSSRTCSTTCSPSTRTCRTSPRTSTPCRRSVAEHLGDFLETGEEKPEEGAAAGLPIPDTFRRAPALRRYQVNVLVDSGGAAGAPVVYESNPSYLNLVGRVEQMSMMGALLTDFTLIKPGVLHRANGGYLILDALKVLTNPYAWEGLKRALQFRQIRIESPGQMLSLTSTVSLEPEPIPLDVKVILMGDRQLYYLLAQSDPDFDELFKIAADFDDEFVRDDETTQQVRAAHRRPSPAATACCRSTAPAVCRVVEHASRLVDDAERVTAQMRTIVDLLQEADHWARRANAELVGAAHVQQAIDAQVYRSDRRARPHARRDAARDGAGRHRRGQGRARSTGCRCSRWARSASGARAASPRPSTSARTR